MAREVWVVVLLLSTGFSSSIDSGMGGRDDDARLIVETEESITAQGGSGSGAASDDRNVEWESAPACLMSRERYDNYHACTEQYMMRREFCDDGSQADDPIWVRYESPPGSGNWTDWELLRWYHCGEETTLEHALRQAWDQMAIEPHEVTIQPPQGWVYASMPTIVYVDDRPRTLTTELLGQSVTLRANPATMTWDWGNGEKTVTKDTGKPYPDHTIHHTYLHQDGEVVITLTTSWTGQYSLDGGASWQDAPGTASTTSDPMPLTIHNPKGHLVDCDLAGNCTSDAWRD